MKTGYTILTAITLACIVCNTCLASESVEAQAIARVKKMKLHHIDEKFSQGTCTWSAIKTGKGVDVTLVIDFKNPSYKTEENIKQLVVEDVYREAEKKGLCDSDGLICSVWGALSFIDANKRAQGAAQNIVALETAISDTKEKYKNGEIQKNQFTSDIKNLEACKRNAVKLHDFVMSTMAEKAKSINTTWLDVKQMQLIITWPVWSRVMPERYDFTIEWKNGKKIRGMEALETYKKKTGGYNADMTSSATRSFSSGLSAAFYRGTSPQEQTELKDLKLLFEKL